ncbi:MAG: LamG domain-containing protein, partial [Colwellia sp.]
TVRTAQQINDNKSKLIDTNPDKLVLYYDFDNNLTNKVFTPLTSAVNSYTANHKTIVDFPGINQAPGYGLQFDGTASSKVAYKTNTDVTYANLLDDKSFTVEFWARNKLDKTATNVNPVFAVKGVDETNSVLIALNNSDITCGTTQNTADTVSASLEVNSRPWLHIACVYNHSEQTLTLYKNGLQVGKQSSVAAASATGEVVVGGNGFGQYFTGELDELRVWQTALTQQQLRSDKNNRIVTNSEHLALYHSFEQAIKIIPDTQFHFVDLINDNKLYSASADTIFTDLNYAPPLHNIDVDGNVIVNRLHSLRFSADKTKFASPVVAESLKNVSEFTLSMWVNFNDHTSSQEFIVGNKEFKLVREVSGSVSLFVAGNPSAIITSSSVININSWQQLALVYSNDVFALYINNTQVGTVADEKPTDFNINEITFGADKQEASTLAALAASIDNIQLWGLGLSAEQVAKYSNATFNGAEANLLVYQTVNQLTLNNDKNIVLDGWQVTGLTLSNVDDNYPLSELTDQQSLYFDGVDDYILTSTHTLDVTNGISIALWSRAATLNNATTLLSHSDDSDSLQLGFTSNKQLTCSLNNLELVSSQAIVENEWFHWGCTFSIQNSELVLSLFKNGDMVDTKKFDQTSNYQVSAKVRLGGDNSRFYHGWVDELSVWSQALTQGDVNALQNATPTSNSTGLISYQDFNNELINQSVLESGGSEQLTYAQGIEYVYAPIEIGATLATGKLKTGLWQGQAVINKVNESHIEVTADNVVTPTKTDSTFLLPFLLHSSLNSTQMLSEVTIMQTKDNGVNPVQKILITDQSLLSNYDGVIRRNGKLTGVRLTALPFGLNCPIAAIHTDSTTGTQSCNYLNTKQTMSGGIYEGGRADIDIRYQEFHPLNPYRHKYHPDLAEGFVINRRISFVVDAYNSEQKKADPQLGVSKLTGTYLEQVTGLHNQTKTDVSSNIVLAPIVSKGTFIMQLVSDIKTLDTLEIAK